jgi:hypothetical protein
METTSGRRFWELQTKEEMALVGALLRRRFGETFTLWEASLNEADPMEIVYPGNPGEYEDVIREVMVLLPSDESAMHLAATEARAVAIEALGRCFGEDPEDERVEYLVRLVTSGSRSS